MKKMTCLILGLVLSLVTSAANAQTTLKIEGSTTVGPIADAFASVFKEKYPDVEISVKKTGSGSGAKSLCEGLCDIALMSRFLKDEEYVNAVEAGVKPVPHVIAGDGVCVIVHPTNPVQSLTGKQLKDIYLGKITDWKDLGGAPGKIVPITRDSASGTFETFNIMVMDKEKMAGQVEVVSSNPQAYNRVKTTPSAIAYVGLGFLDKNVAAVKIDGVAPNRKTIASGEYAISRPLYFFTNGYPKLGSAAHKYCTFFLSEDGQEVIEKKGFVPLTDY